MLPRLPTYCTSSASARPCGVAIPIARWPIAVQPENLLALTVPLDEIIAEDRLREIPGVGDAIADIIAKIHKTGTHAGLEAMRKDIPASVLELLSVPGLRPEKVLNLYDGLGIASLEGLERAARQDHLKNVKVLSAALQSKILQGID